MHHQPNSHETPVQVEEVGSNIFPDPQPTPWHINIENESEQELLLCDEPREQRNAALKTHKLYNIEGWELDLNISLA